MSALSFLKDLLESSTSQPVEIELKRCLRNRLRNFPCTSCQDQCPSGALQLSTETTGRIELEQDKCSNCLRCLAVCPGGAFTSANFSYHELFPPVPFGILSCHRQKKLRGDEHSIPCIGALTPELLLLLAAKREQNPATTLLINVAGCPSCNNHQCYDRFLEIYAVVQPFVADRISLLHDAADRAETDRRSYLQGLRHTVYGAAASRLKNKNRSTASTAESGALPSGRRWLPEKREVFLAELKSLKKEYRERLIPLLLHHPEITENCTHCPRCSGICPTGAVKVVRDGEGNKSMRTDPNLCTGCELCVRFCKVQGITINPAPLASSALPLAVHKAAARKDDVRK